MKRREKGWHGWGEGMGYQARKEKDCEFLWFMVYGGERKVR